MDESLLIRIAEALERLAPPHAGNADLTSAAAYVWDGTRVEIAERFAPPDFDLLAGIDAQKSVLLENSLRLAKGLPAHDALIWGARGTGKSASVAAVIARVRGDGHDIALVQCDGRALASLPLLFRLLAGVARAFVLFVDDLGFEDNGGDARALRSLLEGGANARPANVRLYVTSNRRHIVPRYLSEQDDPINVRDAVDDKLALSDRFGLSLGFHAIDQAQYLGIVAGYARHFGLSFDPASAVQWATQRGSRSGRVAWQYIVEIAGRQGRALTP